MKSQAIRKHGVAVVTGAATGIGYAIASRLSLEGMKVVLFDNNQAALDAAVTSLYSRNADAQLLAVTGDISSDESLRELYVLSRGFGDISVVINNAAIGKSAGPWEETQLWRQIMEINFWGVLRMQQLFTEHLLAKEAPAVIVNLGSKEGITTPPGNAAYSVSKAALRVLTEQLEHELRERTGGRVSAHLLIPGYTFTPMNFPGMTSSTPKPDAPWTAAQVADRLIDGLAQGEFYIFCEDNEVSRELDQRRMQWSAEDLILNRPALSRWHRDYQEEFQAYIADVKLPS
ncbi:oxidoreductase [Pseudomonas sp. LPH1]|nr:SDR family NAD(P)-dependent oxidoreductase [Pseudomonas sp. LPH1]AQZ34709.1 oxidoreductase [Pseudomonas sp. LPH1]